jgi:hypothetical protein
MNETANIGFGTVPGDPARARTIGGVGSTCPPSRSAYEARVDNGEGGGMALITRLPRRKASVSRTA